MRGGNRQSKTRPAIEFHAHPPERGRNSTENMICGCCCCCCCCLHSLGGLVGAAVVTAKGRDDEPGHWGGSIYWLALSACALISGLSLLSGSEMILGMLLLLPAIQLAASVLAAVVILVMQKPDTKAAVFRVLKISVWGFIGAILGIGGMFLALPLLH